MIATNVEVIGDYKLKIVFDDGICGVADMAELTQQGIFRVLQDPLLFAKVYTTGEAIAWNDELEIDALNIYAKITGKDPSEIAQKHFVHAAD